MKSKILIIDNNSNMNINMNLKYFDYCILHSPSKESLEELLLKEDFLCVIPSESKNKNTTCAYNLLRLLEIYGFEYFGNSYLKNQIVKEKAAFLKQSGLHIPSEIWTRTNQKRNYSLLSDSEFPIFIDNHNGYKKIIFSRKKLLIELDNLLVEKYDEITLLKKYEFDRTFNAVLVGSIQQNLFAIDSENQEEIEYLKEKSVELFSKFNFKDFASFVFGRKGKEYFLLDINLNEIFNDTIIKLFGDNYGMEEYQIIVLYVMIILNRNTYINHGISELYNLLPSEILSKIVSLEYKQKLGLDYNYYDVCNELKSRFLSSSDDNRYEFIKLIEKSLENCPKSDVNSYYLGDLDYDYEDYLSSYEEIPMTPKEQKQILNQSLKILNGQIRWNSPLSFYNVCPPVMMNTVAASTITNMYNPNGMIDRTCAGYLNMERQIVRQLSNLLEIDSEESAGIFTAGGKVCLTYAVKCGLNRCYRRVRTNNSPIIITSMANHFSIESVGYQLGIHNCIRISLNKKQEMNYDEFEKNIYNCIKNQIPIACIILSGGNTLHSAVENVKTTKNIVDKYVIKYNLPYTPYIYYDLVVCWPWLFFKHYNFDKNSLRIETEVLKKIQHTSDIFKYANLADGFGFNFHKGGFSPYTTSIFITKNMNELYSINNKAGEIQKDSCYHTFTNSRTATDIISAWNILQSVGTEGFQAYVANMLNVSCTLTKYFKDFGFNVLSENSSFGFATIIWIKSPYINENIMDIIKSKELLTENNQYIYKFTEYLKRNNIANICVRYLPKYNYNNKQITVISLLPMTMNLDVDVAIKVAKKIFKIRNQFDSLYIKNMDFGFNIAPENVPR